MLPKPVTARYYKFVAKSEIAGQPFCAVAELGIVIPPPAAAAGIKPVMVTVRQTNVKNFMDNGDKYLTNFSV